VSFTHERGRHVSGVDVDRRTAFLLRLADGTVSEVRVCLDRDCALADLGLKRLAMPEESTTPHQAELLRRLVDIVNRRAWGELADVFARDGVLDLSDLGLGVYEGADAIRAFGEDWVGAYEKV
jgi:hypothetical protein